MQYYLFSLVKLLFSDVAKIPALFFAKDHLIGQKIKLNTGNCKEF